MNGSRGKLSEEQLIFCGFGPERAPDRGWRPASSLLPPMPDQDDHDYEPAHGIRWLKQIGGERMELTT